MIKNVLVPALTYPDAHSEGFAANASEVALAFGANVDVLMQGVAFPQLSHALELPLTDVPALVNEAKALSAANQKRLEAVFGERSREGRFVVTARTLDTYPTLFPECAAREARYSDLSIVGVRSGVASMVQLAEAVAFGSGRPVLLLPESTMPGAFKHIAIAWDGTAVAARAVYDAQPFLAKAERVTIVTVADDKPIESNEMGTKLTRYLKSHGSDALTQTIQKDSRPIGECLQDYSIEHGADLLVMGAFGHSRMRDFILGGATKGVLEHLRVATLLSH